MSWSPRAVTLVAAQLSTVDGGDRENQPLHTHTRIMWAVNRRSGMDTTVVERDGSKKWFLEGSWDVVFRFLYTKMQPATGKISLILEA